MGQLQDLCIPIITQSVQIYVSDTPEHISSSSWLNLGADHDTDLLYVPEFLEIGK